MSGALNDVYRKQVEILRILSEYDEPIGSSMIRRELARRGFFLSDRTIRYHLKILEERGLVEGHEKVGRTITQAGLEELSRALAYQRIGSILTKYLSLAYRSTYSPQMEEGEVVTNVIMLDKSHEQKALEILGSLYDHGFLPFPYYRLIEEDEEYREVSVPRGKIALLVVCNLTVDGVLIHSGVPIILKYGGLVQLLKRKPLRFIELINYEHTTLHPLEVFVYKRATTILRALETGSGIIPANLREIPMDAREKVMELMDELEKKGWRGILKIGLPNEPLLGVPISLDRFGVSMIGGVTPAAAMIETGIQVETFAPHCLVDLKDMKRIA